MSEMLLSARGLTKTYVMGKRSLEVLRGVDVDIARGDFLALRGASGAGKARCSISLAASTRRIRAKSFSTAKVLMTSLKAS